MLEDNLDEINSGISKPPFYDTLTGEGALSEQAGSSFRETLVLKGAYQSIVNDVDADLEKSEFGKSKAIEAAKKQTVGKVNQVESKLNDQIAKAVSKARASAAKTDPIDKSAEAVRQSEIRRLISEQVGQDGLAMQTLISEAVAVGDTESIAALVDAPLFWRQGSLIEDHAALSAKLVEMHDQRLGLEVGQFIQAGKEMKVVFDNIRYSLEPETADNVKKIATGGGDAE